MKAKFNMTVEQKEQLPWCFIVCAGKCF